MPLLNDIIPAAVSRLLRRRTRRRGSLSQRRAAEVEHLEPRQLLTAILTAEEQYVLELVNRARANPAAEATRLGVGLNEGLAPGTISSDPKQPLAPNDLLNNAAEGHSQDMIDRNFFAHTSPGPGGTTFAQRIANAGYSATSGAENISIRTYNGTPDRTALALSIHDGLYRSSGHRVNIFGESYFELGIGIRFGSWTDNENRLGGGIGVTHDSALGTQNFGASSAKPFITGVVYTDASDSSSSDNQFYDPGEQAGHNGTITATDTTNGATFSATVGPSGGYSLEVPAGTYDVSVAGGGLSFEYLASEISIDSENVKVDFETTTAQTASPTVTGPNSKVTSQRPEITWNALTGATEYEIWIKNQSTDENPFHQATVNGTSYTPTIDLGIGRFNLWIRAIRAGGVAGSWSSQHNFQVTTALEVNAIDRFQDSHRPTLSWDGLPGAARYDVWINDHLGNVNQYIRDSNVTGTSFTPSADMPLGLYRAWVRGVAEDGAAGRWAKMIEFFVAPAPVQTEGMNPTFDQTPTFGWDSVPGATTYSLFARDRNTGFAILNEKGISETQYTPDTPFMEGPYRWWVRAVSEDGVQSQWTDPVDIYVGGRSEILTPIGSTSDSTPTITWRTVDEAVRYDLWVDQIDGTRQIIRDEDVRSTSFTPTTALTAGTYRVWIRAVSSTDISPWSLDHVFEVA